MALDYKLSIACDMLHVKLCLGNVVLWVSLGLKVGTKIHYKDLDVNNTSYDVNQVQTDLKLNRSIVTVINYAA